MSGYIIILFIFFILLLYRNQKEGYKKQKRSGIRGGWKRKGSAARNISLHGTRWHRLPPCEKDEAAAIPLADNFTSRY